MSGRLSREASGRYLRLGMGLFISGLTLYLALRNVSFREVWQVISRADLWLVALAFAFVFVANFAKAMRWRVLLGDKGQQVGLVKIFLAHLAGQTLNVIFPARVGDLSRAYVIGGMGPGRVFTLGTVMVEKIPDLVAYALLFVALISLIPLPQWVGGSGYMVVALATLVPLVVYWVIRQHDLVLRVIERGSTWLPERWRAPALTHLRSALSSLDVLQSRWDVLKVVIWTVLVWTLAIGVNHVVLLALGMHFPLTASLLTLVALQAGILIPSVPGRVGVFEYICVLALRAFGIDQTEALSYGILLHTVVFLPILLLGLAFWGIVGLSEDQDGALDTSRGSQL